MTATTAAPPVHPGLRAMLVYGLLGFSAGLPFYMFSTVLGLRLRLRLRLRLQAHGVALAVLGFFAWVQLLPTVPSRRRRPRRCVRLAGYPPE